MKTLRLISALLTTAALTVSCSSEDPYSAGFIFSRPASPVNTVYANNVIDSIIVYSYGSWTLTNTGGQSGWCTPDRTQGPGATVFSIPLRFTQNTTGEPRSAQFTFYDKNHSDDAHSTLLYWQYATRGDGAMGNAPEVKTITGSDGSRFTFTYDELHRPTALHVTLNETTLHNIQLHYSDYDSTLTVTNNARTMKAHYGSDYQPLLLTGATDTIGYYSQYYNNYTQMPANHAFNIEHHSYQQPTKRYAFLMNGQSLLPDSLHNADSLRIATDKLTENLKLTYSQTDNRRQTVDVNSLIFGTRECDPYQLLSLFRYARNTSVISEATGNEADDRISVTTTLNADKSISTVTVSRHGQQTVYTLEY